MIRLRAVFAIDDDNADEGDFIGGLVNKLLGLGAVAIEIDYDPEEP